MRTGNERWLRRGLLFEDALWQRLKARAEAEKTTISTLVRDILQTSIEAREVGRGAVGPSNAERLLEMTEHVTRELRNLATLIGSVGKPVMASQRLLVHWITHEDSLGVNADDLDAELQAVGAEGWAQILDELRETPDVELSMLAGKPGSEDPE
jgi:hypothetical protein